MREIKFRAWSKVANKMAEVISILPDSVLLRGGEYSGSNNIEDVHLMLYTGLKDKNGVEIYEGDIIATEPELDGFVHKGHLKFGYSIDGQYGYWWSGSKDLVTSQDSISERYEVIGNIYENPELLK